MIKLFTETIMVLCLKGQFCNSKNKTLFLVAKRKQERKYGLGLEAFAVYAEEGNFFNYFSFIQ